MLTVPVFVSGDWTEGFGHPDDATRARVRFFLVAAVRSW
jgi:hypothetical protein